MLMTVVMEAVMGVVMEVVTSAGEMMVEEETFNGRDIGRGGSFATYSACSAFTR